METYEQKMDNALALKDNNAEIISKLLNKKIISSVQKINNNRNFGRGLDIYFKYDGFSFCLDIYGNIYLTEDSRQIKKSADYSYCLSAINITKDNFFACLDCLIAQKESAEAPNKPCFADCPNKPAQKTE